MSLPVNFKIVRDYSALVGADLCSALPEQYVQGLWEQIRRGEILCFSFWQGEEYLGCAVYMIEDFGDRRDAVASHVIGHKHRFSYYADTLLNYLARNARCTHIRTHIDSDNMGMQKIAEKNGFMPIEIVYLKPIEDSENGQ